MIGRGDCIKDICVSCEQRIFKECEAIPIDKKQAKETGK